jgi:hypothetical protein
MKGMFKRVSRDFDEPLPEQVVDTFFRAPVEL